MFCNRLSRKVAYQSCWTLVRRFLPTISIAFLIALAMRLARSLACRGSPATTPRDITLHQSAASFGSSLSRLLLPLMTAAIPYRQHLLRAECRRSRGHRVGSSVIHKRLGLRRDSLGTREKQVAYQQRAVRVLQIKIAAKPHVLPRNSAQLFSPPLLALARSFCKRLTILVRRSPRIALNS
jgi:hypothetical protein